MPRSVKEWIGRNHDARPHRKVYDRVYERAGGCCQSCGFTLSKKSWHCDHITPLKDGGENRESNLQALCACCHRTKTIGENSARAKTTRIKLKHIGIPREPKIKVSRKFNGTLRRWTRELGWHDVD